MRSLIAASLVLGMSVTAAAAQEAPEADPSLQQIVEQSAERFVAAFGQRDAAAIAGLFTAEAEYVDASGTVFHGREAIGAEFAARFEIAPPGTMTVALISIRPIAEGVMVEEGVSTFTPKEDGAASQTRYVATHVKQGDGKWLMASVRELQTAPITPHDRLHSLNWLIGRWHEDVGGNVVSSEWKWSDDGSFLVSNFTIRQAADLSWTGTHRIGWDAERKQFRSWIFESDGGAAEGWWRPNGDGSWSLRLGGVDSTGRRRSSTLTYSPDGEAALVVSQTDRNVAGRSLPDAMHRVVRQPPEPKNAASPKEDEPAGDSPAR